MFQSVLPENPDTERESFEYEYENEQSVKVKRSSPLPSPALPRLAGLHKHNGVSTLNQRNKFSFFRSEY